MRLLCPGEPRVGLEQIKEEWLVGNSVVAFVGALMMAQTWEPSDVKSVIPIINVTVPTSPQAVTLGIVTFLLVLSIVLAVASSVPRLRSWAIQPVSPLWLMLDMLLWFAFLLSFLSVLSEIPRDEWWSNVLALSGLALSFFLAVRMVLRPLIPAAKWLVRYREGLRSGHGSDSSNLGEGLTMPNLLMESKTLLGVVCVGPQLGGSEGVHSLAVAGFFGVTGRGRETDLRRR